MELQETESKLDIKKVLHLLYKEKKLFIKGICISFILACLWILPQPRYYISEVSLAPEAGKAGMDASISSIASSFGFNLDGVASEDAIYPLIYPDIISSSNFLVSLFDIQVITEDGSIRTDYYTYMTQYQQSSFWMWPVNWVKDELKKLFQKEEKIGGEITGSKAFWLSEKESNLVESMRSNIQCSIDLKTQVVTITVQDQDRLICATLADSVRARLQAYITNYRTSKARIDAIYYKQLLDSANVDYEKSVEEYSRYADTHTGMIMQVYKSERDKLEQEMQIKYSTYTAFTTQYQAAVAKIQERTPAFTIIQEATVPQKPAGPKRMIFIAAMMMVSCLGISIYVLRRYLF